MSWRQGPQDFSRLHNLGNITARLIRITAFEKIKRGEAQLCSYGLPPGLVAAYKEHALAERHTLIPQKDDDLENHLNITVTERSVF